MTHHWQMKPLPRLCLWILVRIYIFEIQDSFGDGICCANGNGFVYIYLGTTPKRDRVILFDDGNFGFGRQQSFNASDTGLLGFTSFPSNSPSTSLTPSQSAQPSRSSVLISVWIQLNVFAISISWEIIRKVDREVIFSVSPGSYGVPLARVNQTLSVEAGVEYVFVVMDIAGLGLCCDWGYGNAFVYLGSEPSDDMVLVFDDGQFELERNHTFVASSSGILDEGIPTAAPTATNVAITVFFSLDRMPEEFAWAIAEADPFSIIAGFEYGTYTVPNANVTVTLNLQQGVNYSIELADLGDNGICCTSGNGFFGISFGTVAGKQLLYYNNGSFGDYVNDFFVVSEDSITATPSSGPIVTPTLSSSTVPTIFAPSTIPSVAPSNEEPIQCFSGRTQVKVEGRGYVGMGNLKIGDSVLVRNNKYEPVYSFGHKHNSAETEYIQIFTDSSHQPIEISRDHMIFLEGLRSVPASSVEVGDNLIRDGGDPYAPLLAKVVSIKTAVRTGSYAPFTESGTIVVNGILASCFVAFQGKEHLHIGGIATPLSYQWLAHIFEAPHRIIFNLGLCKRGDETYTPEGLSHWVDAPLKVSRWMLRQHSYVLCLVLIPALASFAVVALFEYIAFRLLSVISMPFVLLAVMTVIYIFGVFAIHDVKTKMIQRCSSWRQFVGIWCGVACWVYASAACLLYLKPSSSEVAWRLDRW